jgi:hypothetical protein
MTDGDIVYRFHAIIGRGNVREYDVYGSQKKRTWQWSVQGRDDVLYVLALLWDYLGERRCQAASEVIERAAKISDGDGFCRRGHDLSQSEHVYVHQKSGKRYCRTCRDARGRERRRVSRPGK